MSITIETEGFNKFAATLQAASANVSKKVEQAVVTTAFALHSDLIERLSQIGTGIAYKRRGVTHIASAPGEPPAVDTGAYRSSWDVDTSKASQGEAAVFTNDQRGPWLEFGTIGTTVFGVGISDTGGFETISNTVGMEPRPHLGPAVEAIRPVFDKNLEEALGETLEGK